MNTDVLATPAKWRDDTTLEAAGAELLVIGYLLINGFQVYRAYGNQPGYDALVVNPANASGKSIKLQIKSRVALNSGRFKIAHPDFDFCIFVRLNRGTKLQRRDGTPATEDVEYYIVSKQDVCLFVGVENPDDWVTKQDFRISRNQLSEHRGAWHLIATALNAEA